MTFRLQKCEPGPFRRGVVELVLGASQNLMSRPTDNVATLDVLRSLAILLVFSTHFAGEFHALPSVFKFPFFYWGWTGVDLFFILSGILIGGQLWRELNKNGRIRIGRFILRRGFRIWPLYYGVIALISCEALFFGRSSKDLLTDTLFLANYCHHSQTGGSWSLSTEEQFYILAPILISLLAFKLKEKHLWVLPISALGLLIAVRAVQISSSTLSVYDLQKSLYYPLHTHADGLAMGLLLSWLAAFHRKLFHSVRFRLGASIGMVGLGAILYTCNHVLFSYTSLALIYGAAALNGMGLSATPKILNWRGFYVVSRLSYGIYLNHFGILPKLLVVLGKWRISGGEPAFWACYVISFLVCMAFATVTFYIVEWPFLVLRKRLLDHRVADKLPSLEQIPV